MELPARILTLVAATALAACGDRASDGAVTGSMPVSERSGTPPIGDGDYLLVAPLLGKQVHLVDRSGTSVHHWDTAFVPGQCAYLLNSGNLLATGRDPEGDVTGGGAGGRLSEYDWDGNLVWDHRVASATLLAHHDVEPLPNGNVLVVAWEVLSRERAIELGRDPEQIKDAGFWPLVVLELRPIRPTGAEVVWEWHAADHLVQDFDATKEGFGDVPAHPERIDVNADHRSDVPLTAEERAAREEVRLQMESLGYIVPSDDGADGAGDGEMPERRGPSGDWLHTNSIDWHPEHDLIVLSLRHLSEFVVIDHSTTTEEARGSRGGRFGRGGDLLYRYGNPRNYGRGTAADRRLFEQHDARWIDGDGLRVLVLDNGRGRPDGDYTTVDEIVLPFDRERGFELEDGAAFGPSAAAWRYGARESERFYASFVSGAVRLANGNTVICDGPIGRVFEVDPEGRTTFEFENTFVGALENVLDPEQVRQLEQRRRAAERREQRGDGKAEEEPAEGPAVRSLEEAGLFRVECIDASAPALARLAGGGARR